MKPRFKTTIGSKKDRDMMASKYSSTLAVTSEVSISFQDELAATIHGAFEVAVEVAIREVSKLVGQALGDVRDQMHETLRENKSLKLRLLSAETELDSARRAAADGRQESTENQPAVSETASSNCEDAVKRETLFKENSDQDNTSGSVTANGTKDPFKSNAQGGRCVDGTFSEICEDGRVCSQSINAIQPEESPSTSAEKDVKPDLTIPCSNDDNKVIQCHDKQSSQEAVAFSEEVVMAIQIKEEKSDVDLASATVPRSDDEQLGFNTVTPDADGLSLAQSQLLEDWRPTPLDLPPCDNGALNQGSHGLVQSMAVSIHAAEMSSTSMASLPIFPTPLSALYPNDSAPLPHAPPPHSYGGRTRPGVPAQPPPAAALKQHVCKFCGRPFERPSDLRRHQSQHHRSKPANSTLRSGGRPPKQQKYPPGRSPYHCDECGRDFNRLENLKTHLRIHTGERPYTCAACGMRFRHSGALTRHFRIHTGEKPYVCSQCGMSFRNSGGLRFHQRLHNR